MDIRDDIGTLLDWAAELESASKDVIGYNPRLLAEMTGYPRLYTSDNYYMDNPYSIISAIRGEAASRRTRKALEFAFTKTSMWQPSGPFSVRGEYVTNDGHYVDEKAFATDRGCGPRVRDFIANLPLRKIMKATMTFTNRFGETRRWTCKI